MNIKEYYTSSGCSTNVQYCPKTCTPKLKYFGITDDMVSCVEKDDLGNIKTLCINADYPNPPKLTVQDYKAMYYDTINKEYVDFDSTLYNNIYVKAYKDNVYGDSSSYSISIEQQDCSKKAIISNITLYRPSDYYIKNVSNDGQHIKLTTPAADSISSALNKKIQELNLLPDICQKAFYYEIKDKDINFILNSLNSPSNQYGSTNKDYSIILKDNLIEKPFFTITGGSLQYLDSNGEYKNFEDNLYQNVQLQVFRTKTLMGSSQTIDNDFIIRISQKDFYEPMILADKALFPFQNYAIGNILDDGTIIQLPIQNSFSGLLG